jgi:hypothetical protein
MERSTVLATRIGPRPEPGPTLRRSSIPPRPVTSGRPGARRARRLASYRDGVGRNPIRLADRSRSTGSRWRSRGLRLRCPGRATARQRTRHTCRWLGRPADRACQHERSRALRSDRAFAPARPTTPNPITYCHVSCLRLEASCPSRASPGTLRAPRLGSRIPESRPPYRREWRTPTRSRYPQIPAGPRRARDRKPGSARRRSH